MYFELLRVAAALVGTGAAAYQDAKTSYIDDRITGAMIALGIVLNLLENDQSFWWSAFGIALLIGAAGYFLYRAGQFGGGDVLLFLGLQMLLPVYPAELLNAPLALLLPAFPFALSVFLASSYFAVVGSAAWYAWRLLEKKAKLEKERLFLFSGACVALAFFFVFFPGPLTLLQKTFFLLLLWAGAFMLLFKNEIMDCVVVRKLKTSEIEDEDILAIDKLPKRLVAKYGLQKVLTGKQVALLKKIEKETKRKLFPVCKELPRFGPYVLLGLVASLLTRDLFLWLLLG